MELKITIAYLTFAQIESKKKRKKKRLTVADHNAQLTAGFEHVSVIEPKHLPNLSFYFTSHSIHSHQLFLTVIFPSIIFTAMR